MLSFFERYSRWDLNGVSQDLTISREYYPQYDALFSIDESSDFNALDYSINTDKNNK